MKKFRFSYLSVGLLVAIFIGHSVATARGPWASGSAVDAKTLFDTNCAKCHGRDGRSKTTHGRRTHSRDLTSAEWQNDVSDERIFNSISNGKGKMPAFKKTLSEAEIDSLITYVRRLTK